MALIHFRKLHIFIFVPRLLTVLLVLFVGSGIVLGMRYYQYQQTTLAGKLAQTRKALNDLQNVDQYKRNNELQATMSAMQKTFSQTVTTYQDLLDLKQNIKDASSYDTLFAQILKYLADKNYASGAASLDALDKQISDEQAKLAAASVPAVNAPQNVTASNTAPGNGYSRQSVSTPNGTFVVDIIAADMGSTKVVVDTASSSDCSNNCPTLPLSDYVSRNGAYAGINGNFFCPADYPSCAGKTGSFDLLVMNKNKVYFNSSNNVYSTNPVVVFGSGFVRFIGAASGWGRDTSVDSVLSNFPLLVSGGNVVFSGSDDPKFGSKGPRGFVANRGNTVYIGDVYNANMSDSAQVMKTLGMDNAMNLDEGGSTALMFNGSYLAGPGRNIPDAILFLHK